jgi:hypothetical protein
MHMPRTELEAKGTGNNQSISYAVPASGGILFSVCLSRRNSIGRNKADMGNLDHERAFVVMTFMVVSDAVPLRTF